MNKVILMGRLTRNPEVRYSQGENSMAIARFTLAVDRRFKRDSEATADFIGCVAFGKQAEFFEKYVHQGTKVCLEGRIQTGSYTKQDGTKVYTTDIVVENVEFAESKAASSGQSSQQGYSNNQQSYSNNQQGFAGQQNYSNQQYQQPQAQQPLGGQPSFGASQSYQAPAPMQEAADEGFMQIPDGMTDEGLPFN